MTIIGIDPGTVITGYGIVETVSGQCRLLDYGCIRPPAGKLSARYLAISDSVDDLIVRYAPKAIAVETQYVHKNVQSAIKLGMARGVIILAATKRGVPVFEYSPTKAKKAVVGNGRASKQQVGGMIKMLFNLPEVPAPEDAADALALAVCHFQASKVKALAGPQI